jgi:hypothetical protein
MASEIGIANAALARIGATRIESFTDGTKNANTMNDLFEETRDDLLRGHNWNFCTERIELAQTAARAGFAAAHTLPSDWMRTVSVHASADMTDSVDYREEGGVILSNASAIFLRFISRTLGVDPNRMPPDFRSALAAELAFKCCTPLGKSAALRAEVFDEARLKLGKAKSADAMNSAPEKRPRGSWASARGGRSTLNHL